jgi:hypothetical protein
MNVYFFNHWHHGDLFSTRGLVQDIKNQLGPDHNYYYSHRLHPSSTSDLAQFSPDTLNRFGEGTKAHREGDTIFINTWVGCWGEFWRGAGHDHPSYIEHFNSYRGLYGILTNNYGMSLRIPDDVWNFIPDMNYIHFNTGAIDGFVTGKDIVLISNSEVKSKQSQVGNMENMINVLSNRFPHKTFVITEDISQKNENVIYSSDITGSTNDLGELSYLSTLSTVLIGKNSSPFTYFQTKRNLLDSNKTFLCFSNVLADTLPEGLDIKSKFIFSNDTNEENLINMITSVLTEE